MSACLLKLSEMSGLVFSRCTVRHRRTHHMYAVVFISHMLSLSSLVTCASLDLLFSFHRDLQRAFANQPTPAPAPAQPPPRPAPPQHPPAPAQPPPAQLPPTQQPYQAPPQPQGMCVCVCARACVVCVSVYVPVGVMSIFVTC